MCMSIYWYLSDVYIYEHIYVYIYIYIFIMSTFLCVHVCAYAMDGHVHVRGSASVV